MQLVPGQAKPSLSLCLIFTFFVEGLWDKGKQIDAPYGSCLALVVCET